MTELPLSLSVATIDGMCIRMLERGAKVPASAERVFTAKKFLPPAVMAEVVMGERTRAKDNKRIKRVRVGGIRKSAGGIARISVKLEVSDDGSLKIEMFDFGSHHKKRKLIRPEKWVPDQEYCYKAVEEAEKNIEEDRRIDGNCRLAGKARTAVLIADTLKRNDRKQFTPEELSEIKAKAKDLKSRIRTRPENFSDVDVKIIHEETTSIHKLLEKVTPPARE